MSWTPPTAASGRQRGRLVGGPADQCTGNRKRTLGAEPSHDRCQVVWYEVKSPFHGGNRGSNPLGRASKIRHFSYSPSSVSNTYPINRDEHGALTCMYNVPPVYRALGDAWPRKNARRSAQQSVGPRNESRRSLKAERQERFRDFPHPHRKNSVPPSNRRRA